MNTRYSSDEDDRIYQSNPIWRKTSMFAPKGWTDTVEGYINEANALSRCILRNRRYMKTPYAWAVHINHNDILPVELLAEFWTAACRTLRRRGVVALWVREANRLNKMHYHLIIKDPISEKALKRAIEDAMPPRNEARWRKRIEPIRDEWRLAHYVTKAKIKGRRKGRVVDDLHAPKRLLFKPGLKLKKYGNIGDFWAHGKNKESLWSEIISTEKRIGEGLDKPEVRRLAEHAREFLGDDVPLAKIERALGYWSEGLGVRQWIKTTFGGK